MQLTKSQLVNIAKELNEQLGIEPPIDTELDRAELKSKVRDASALVTPNDKLSDSTRKVVEFFQSEAAEPASNGNGKAETETKEEAAAEGAEKPAKAPKATKPKGEKPGMKHEGSMAQFIDALVQKTTDVEKIKAMLEDEATKRGIKAPTIGAVRAHVKFRQSKGHLQGIEIPR